MELSDKRLLVTGGAGFVGAPLAARLATDNEVVVADDLSNGSRDRVPDGATFVAADLTDPEAVADVVTADLDAVFHLAAASKRVDADDPRAQFEANTAITYNLLERAAAVDVDRVAFTSSSTVYGEAPMPTPEDYAPLEPISVYGATKLAEESLLSTYAHSHGVQVWNVRFANIVGPGLRGAVVPDFVEKLRADPGRLEILGDGRQEKSYMHVEDCVAALCHVVEHADAAMNTYNLGTRTTTSVTRIADVVADVLGLDPTYEYTGGDRGWTGDVPRMRLSIEKLSALGFEPDLSSDAAVRRAAEELAAELD
ncbi:MAG: NAD-dependent epimerase/dehydratase family protein [Haloarculaceae archaeon]